MSQNETNQTKPQGKPSKQSIEDGIGIRLKAARESKGLTHSELHRVTGLSRMVISKYEAGLNKPGTRELRLICDALEVSPNQLIYGTEEPHKHAIGLADTLIGMGESAILPVTLIAPLLAAMLGKDDLRMILSLIETVLKAKSPEDYRMVIELVQVFKEIPQQERGALVKRLQSEPEAQKAFQQKLQQRLMAAAKQS